MILLPVTLLASFALLQHEMNGFKLFPFADFLLNLSADHNLCGHVGFVELCRHHASKETVTPLRQASLARLQYLYHFASVFLHSYM